MLLIVATYVPGTSYEKWPRNIFLRRVFPETSLVLYAFIIATPLRLIHTKHFTVQCLEMQMVPSEILRY